MGRRNNSRSLERGNGKRRTKSKGINKAPSLLVKRKRVRVTMKKRRKA